MKKNLIFLVLALAALGLVFLLKDKRQESTKAQSFAYDSTRIAEASQFKVVRDTDTVVVAFDQTRWVVLPDSFPADTSRVNMVLQKLFTLQDGQVASRNEERISEFGMEAGEAKTVTISNSQGAVLVDASIGKTSGADYNSTFWKYPGKPEIFRTPGNFTWEIAHTAEDWKSRSLFSFTPDNAKAVNVSWTDGTAGAQAYRLEAANDSTWMLVEPVQDTVRDQRAQNILERLAELNIDQFVTESDTNAAKADLNSPYLSLTVELKDGRSIELKTSSPLDGFVYVPHPSFSQLVKLSDWRIEPFRTTPDILRGAQPEDEHDHHGHDHDDHSGHGH